LVIAKLREKEIMATGSLKALKKLCDQNQVPTAEFIQKIKQGWVGKQKGLLQILWERGWIDIASLGKYTIEGSLDGFGIKRYDTSLKHLMANCVDFEEEESLLRSIGTKMGVIVDRTPKCHCELAGEGVEYSWGCAKNEYRRKPHLLSQGGSNSDASAANPRSFSDVPVKVEKLLKEFKTHRSASDFAKGFITSVMK